MEEKLAVSSRQLPVKTKSMLNTANYGAMFF